MTNTKVDFENRNVWMEGTYASKPVHLKNAKVVESLSKLTKTTVEFLSSNDALDLQDILGSTITLVQKDADDKDRYFTGVCVSTEYVGIYQGMSHFVAEVRPWLWFLTRTSENRIFQKKTVLEILQEVLEDYGFWSDVQKKTTGSYKSRTYCVQYNETDFDFICRLMEEEGIYYFFVQDGKKLKMVLADSISAHKPTPEKLSEYECGFPAFEDPRSQFDVRFYLVAILFIIFDLEAAFLYPWAVSVFKLGWVAWGSMMLFIVELALGLVYAWKKGALEWE